MGTLRGYCGDIEGFTVGTLRGASVVLTYFHPTLKWSYGNRKPSC